MVWFDVTFSFTSLGLRQNLEINECVVTHKECSKSLGLETKNIVLVILNSVPKKC